MKHILNLKWRESFRKREATKTINNFYKKNKHIEVGLCYALNEAQVTQVENSFPEPYSLQSWRNFGGQVHSIITAEIIDLIFTAAEGWGEKEICFKGASDSKKKERGEAGAMNIKHFPAPSLHLLL